MNRAINQKSIKEFKLTKTFRPMLTTNKPSVQEEFLMNEDYRLTVEKFEFWNSVLLNVRNVLLAILFVLSVVMIIHG